MKPQTKSALADGITLLGSLLAIALCIWLSVTDTAYRAMGGPPDTYPEALFAVILLPIATLGLLCGAIARWLRKSQTPRLRIALLAASLLLTGGVVAICATMLSPALATFQCAKAAG